MINEEQLRLLEFHEGSIKAWCYYYQGLFYGQQVTLTKGKYRGRKAIISGVIPDYTHGMAFCCMVLTKDGSRMLNSDGATRSYLPREYFELEKVEQYGRNDTQGN